MSPQAVIFDMDGVLIDSEPLWRRAEVEVLRPLGVPLTEAMCHETTGLNIVEVVALWRRRYPSARIEDDGAVADRILDRMEALIGEVGAPCTGALEAVERVGASGCRLALASGSAPRLIDAVLRRLDLADAFECARSAHVLRYGKPHPQIYIDTAAALGVPETACVAIEDSINGMVSARAARMKVVAVPAAEARDDPRYSLADTRLQDLHGVTWNLLESLFAR